MFRLLIVLSIICAMRVTASSWDTAAFIAHHEGFCSHAYWDHKQWSIGYGMKSKKGETISKKDAFRQLVIRCVELRKQVRQLVIVPLTENQLTALVSFTYNEGLSAFRKSTLRKVINQRKSLKNLQYQWMRWIYVGGKPNHGLQNRRYQEWCLYNKKGD